MYSWELPSSSIKQTQKHAGQNTPKIKDQNSSLAGWREHCPSEKNIISSEKRGFFKADQTLNPVCLAVFFRELPTVSQRVGQYCCHGFFLCLSSLPSPPLHKASRLTDWLLDRRSWDHRTSGRQSINSKKLFFFNEKLTDGWMGCNEVRNQEGIASY